VGTPLIECGWHGWQFDVRSGENLTAGDRLGIYRVIIEDGVIEIEVWESAGKPKFEEKLDSI
jgi:nitrite reductase/ring-hydroxylating ferredoxin subunit